VHNRNGYFKSVVIRRLGGEEDEVWHARIATAAFFIETASRNRLRLRLRRASHHTLHRRHRATRPHLPFPSISLRPRLPSHALVTTTIVTMDGSTRRRPTRVLQRRRRRHHPSNLVSRLIEWRSPARRRLQRREPSPSLARARAPRPRRRERTVSASSRVRHLANPARRASATTTMTTRSFALSRRRWMVRVLARARAMDSTGAAT